MPDTNRVSPLTAAEASDEMWQEVARLNAGDPARREAAERARAAVVPGSASPMVLPLPVLLTLEGDAFVEAAYATLLNRVPDPAGIAYFESELARGRSKIELLGALQASAEAKGAGRTLPGLRRRYLVRRFYRVPLVGPLARAGGAVLRGLGVSRLLSPRGTAQSRSDAQLAALSAAIDSRRRALEARLDEQNAAVEHTTRRMTAMQAATEDMQRRALSAVAEQGKLLQALQNRTAELGRQMIASEDGVIDAVLSLADRVGRLDTRLEAIERTADTAAAKRQIVAAAGELRAELEVRVLAAEAAAAASRRELADQQRRIGLILHAVRERAPERAAEEADHALDALYVSFEDRFRGSRETIKDRQRVYLARLRAAGAGTAERPVLDIGAGRGEWLELLREDGLVGLGVDSNEAMVAACREAGLACEEGDALEWMASRPPGSLGAVSGFHIVEHLPFKVTVRIIDEALRALAPGGLLILETPNPANILTASRWFWLDPTHRNPIPGEMLAMIAEARGFTLPEILPLHPMEARFPGSDRRLAEALDDIFHGPQDYALIARKP